MNILVTSGASQLARAVVESLSATHQVLVTERVSPAGGAAVVPSRLAVAALGSDYSTNLLVRGVEVIVHCGEPLDGEDSLAYLDVMTRGTYNLLLAAVQEGVRRVVYLSTLKLMAGHDPANIVTERWRTLPKPTMPLLGKHMGELVCREFAREHALEVVVLRLGELIEPGTGTVPAPGSMWLDRRDLCATVGAAVTATLPQWSVLHVQSRYPGARFPVNDARQLLGYEPVADPATAPTTPTEGASVS